MDMSGTVARAIGETFDREYGGVKVGGAGMDMGFHLVYVLSRELYGSGYQCVGERCPSNEHVNPGPLRNVYDGRTHKDGYALRHRWL